MYHLFNFSLKKKKLLYIDSWREINNAFFYSSLPSRIGLCVSFWVFWGEGGFLHVIMLLLTAITSSSFYVKNLLLTRI